jgi:hypothetical protein
MYRFALSLLISSAVAYAGQIYGTIRDAAGKPMPGVAIKIVSPTKATYEAKTGADGAYRVFVTENGKCEFQAMLGGKAPATVNVFSYAEPTKYDFEVVGGNIKVK